jgi:SNF2 family DNA or RNA helicase
MRAVEPPEGFAAVLRPYQQQGLDWLQFLREYELAGILADDKGLGKTIQTLAHLLVEKQTGGADRPSLVIAPTSLMHNWKAGEAPFRARMRVLILQGAARKKTSSG